MTKRNRYNVYFAIWTAIFVFIGWRAMDAFFLDREATEDPAPTAAEEETQTAREKDSEDKKENPEEEEKILDFTKKIVYDLSFTAQAPFGEWSDPRQQDGCEEAAALMAVSWARGETFTLQEAKNEILSMSRHTENKYGEFRDTSAIDTYNWIYKDYLGFKNASIKYGITTEDIKRELYSGNLVVVPTNGRKLQNRYFTPPGPERHMFVIKGYDPATNEFITNDNGTRYGENYRYKESILSGALMDYPTGYHEPIINFQTAMIVISPE